MNRCFLLAVAIATVYTVAETSTGQCGKNVIWTLDEDTKVVVFSGKGDMGECDIPGKSSIVSAIIEEGITSIPNSAFDSYSHLESVSISKTLQFIGKNAFAGRERLKQINVSQDNPYLSSIDGIVYDKAGTTMYIFPCGKTDNFTTPDFVQTVGKLVFSSCNSLLSVSFGDSVTKVFDNAFDSCFSLLSVSFGKNVKSIGDDVFQLCPELQSFNVSEDNPRFKSVDGVLFDHSLSTIIRFPCGKSDNYTIPNSVTTIGNHALKCSSLKSVEVGNNVVDIGESAFSGSDIESLSLPGTVETIGPYCFSFCTKLKTFVIPDSVTVVDQNAFEGCTSLKKITIGNSVKEIGAHAFSFAVNLLSLSIPDSVITIGLGAFSGDTLLESVTIGKSLLTIDGLVFEECPSLKNISVDERNEQFVSIDGVLIDKSANKILRYPAAKESSNYTTPDFVKAIGTFSFTASNNLISIVIGESVTSIGGLAFRDCANLTYVAYLGLDQPQGSSSGTFSGCDKISTVCVRHKYCCQRFCGYSHLSDLSQCGVSFTESSSSSYRVVPFISFIVFVASLLVLSF